MPPEAIVEDSVETPLAEEGGDIGSFVVTGPLVFEGLVTGDGREFAPGGLTWPDPIAPGEVTLRWNKEDSHGGAPHTVTVNVGRIDRIWRDGEQLFFEGVFNPKSEDARTVFQMVQDGFLRGISIDADSIADAEVEVVWPEGNGPDMDDPLSMVMSSPEKVIYHKGRIRAATLVDIPAFLEAYVQLKDASGNLVACAQPVVDQPEPEVAADGALVSSVASREDWKPPAEWFNNPELSVLTPIVVTPSGRVYGHAADKKICHIGFQGERIRVPHEASHDYFLTGTVLTADGSTVSVGQITVSTGHAPLSYGVHPATEHYDNTGAAVADVVVGNDEFGIWVAGAVRPFADASRVHELRASGQVSGDWRTIGGKLRLVGLLGVNVGGFPVPRTQARVASGELCALVAAGLPGVGRPVLTAPVTVEMSEQQAMRIVMGMLSRDVRKAGSDV